MKTEGIIHERYGAPLLLDEIDIPDPKEDEVVVKLFASGICGSQLINLGNPRTAVPELLGHEGTGIVVQAGKNVSHVREGDHVLVSWLPYQANEKTEYLQWSQIQWRGQPVRTLIFTWARHTILHAQFVSRMDEDFEKYTSSIIGCAGIAGYGTVLRTVSIKPGQSAAVFGVGGLGVLAVNAARNLQANPIVAIDRDDKKLEFSKKFGATHTVNTTTMNSVEEIQKITNGGADFVFDMVGAPEIREQTILAARAGIPGYSEGGTTVLVGFPTEASEFNPRSILMGQRTYKGSRGGGCIPARDFPLFYQAYRDGTFLLDEAVTTRIGLDEINETVQELAEGKILGRAIIEIA
ncbi:MAG: zinc-binding dehydrogenase [bacterium]